MVEVSVDRKDKCVHLLVVDVCASFPLSPSNTGGFRCIWYRYIVPHCQ